MSNLPTCLVALRAEIGSTLVETERRLESRVVQVEQAFSSLGWEADQLRNNLKHADRDAALLQETNAALLDRIGKAEEAWTRQNIELNQARDEIRDLRAELTQKLSAERSELETVQKLLDQARLERDEARLSRQALLLEHRGVKNLNRAQGERIEAATVGLDVLADMVKDLQHKLEISEARRTETEDDYGKLVGEHEDYVRKYEHLRNEHEHALRTIDHCTGRVTAEELFVKFKPFVYDLLRCIGDMTLPAVSALQYGSHHGHQTLHKHIVKYRRFLDQRNNKWGTPPGEVPDEVLRDNQG